MKNIILISLICFVLTAYAAIYMKQDANGNIIYTDVPFNHAKKINVPSGNQTPSSIRTETAAPKTTSALPDAPQAREAYTRFEIISPKNQETIQNQPNITVDLEVVPELQPGDKIVLLLDGKAYGSPQTNTKLQIDNIDRGSHQLAAVIIDADNKVVMESAAILIFVQRASIQNPSTTRPPPPPPTTMLDTIRSLLSIR